MEKSFTLVDLRNQKSFPNLAYRFSGIKELFKRDIGYTVELSRDFLGENSLHFYLLVKSKRLIVANNIVNIKHYLENRGIPFIWNYVRAIHNNSVVYIDKNSFINTKVKTFFGESLQDYKPPYLKRYSDIHSLAPIIGKLLIQGVDKRISTIDKEETIGILLSGGLDSMTIAYLLSKTNRKFVAFTLKTNDNSHDVVKARKIAMQFNISLVEVEAQKIGDKIFVKTFYKNKHKKVTKMHIPDTVEKTLEISGNPKKDNILCALAMYIIAPAIKDHGIDIVFSGEGPNEMINDYGFEPGEYGYEHHHYGSISFREALTYGVKTDDLQLGRGGLAKHALSRMGKIFSYYNIRLESPYFDKEIAKLMTNIPYGFLNFYVIKQHVVSKMFPEKEILKISKGIVKEKFQDGSGISQIFKKYSQEKFLDIFEKIYGIRKNSYLKSK